MTSRERPKYQKIAEGIRIRLENRHLVPNWKKSHFLKKFGIFLKKVSYCRKPERRPIKFAKRFFQAKNVFKSEGSTIQPKELFRKSRKLMKSVSSSVLKSQLYSALSTKAPSKIIPIEKLTSNNQPTSRMVIGALERGCTFVKICMFTSETSHQRSPYRVSRSAGS